MHRFTITLPTQYNDGRPIPRETRGYFENLMLGAFGGFTATESLGAWVEYDEDEDAPRVYVEPVTVYTLDSDEDETAERDRLAEYAARDLGQSAIYVTHVEPDGSQSRAFIGAPVV